MDTITRNVKDIQPDDRRALEHVIGHNLLEDQQLIINVVSPQKPNVSPVPDESIPAWWKIYEGLGDEDIDRLDQAIRQRANLTRSVE